MKAKISTSFFKSVMILASGSIIAQLITVLSSPILTRLYTPEEIGVYTYLLSIATLFSPIMNARYDMSIVTEEKEENIFPLIKISLLIGLVGSLLISIGYLFYILLFSDSDQSPMYTVVYMFLLLISYSIINVLVAYNNRMKEYKIMTSVYVIRTFCQNIGSIIIGVFNIGSMGLLIPYTLGQFLGINKQGQSLKKYWKDIFIIKSHTMKSLLKKHKNQLLYSTPSIFINGFSYTSITIFIQALYDMSTVGFYSFSVRLLGLPLAVVSGNISKVFFEEASREYRNTKQFRKILYKTILFQSVLALPMVYILMNYAPMLFEVIFGVEWAIAGEYVVVLAPMFGLRFIVSSVSLGMVIANKQNIELLFQLVFILGSIVCFILGKVLSLSVLEYLTAISYAFSVGYILFLIILFKYSRQSN